MTTFVLHRLKMSNETGSSDKMTSAAQVYCFIFIFRRPVMEEITLNRLLYSIDKQKKRLIKAKEIIKDLLKVLPKENIEGIYEIIEAAEQFLREV